MLRSTCSINVTSTHEENRRGNTDFQKANVNGFTGQFELHSALILGYSTEQLRGWNPSVVQLNQDRP